MKQLFSVMIALVLITGCDKPDEGVPESVIDALAREYLFLELSMGRHDPGHVDAYFGPQEIQDAADEADLALDEIEVRIEVLTGQLASLYDVPNDLLFGDWSGDAKADAAQTERIDGLMRRLHALRTRIALRKGQALSFDEESQALFGAVAPDREAEYFEAILEEIDTLLGGEGALPERVMDFRNQFIIPPERLADVFDAAINECRRRTLQHMDLPENESFSIEYVNDRPWSGYNWYQGNARSLIQVNTDLPVFISRAVDLGCHEGYPGHHTFNALLEKHLVQDKGMIEYSLYPLFSPQSLIAEGSGNYGIDLAFPGEERIRFERDVLFPLAGLDATEADRYYELSSLLAKLNYAGNEAARDYLNGAIDREQAIQWLVDYELSEPERARQRTDFFDTYRSYVINYNLGKDIVREYVERGDPDLAERWARFEELLVSAKTAADLD